MRKFHYFIYDRQGKVLLERKAVSETLFQYDYSQYYLRADFGKAVVEVIYE